MKEEYQKEFAPHEVALAMRDMDFDKPCFAVYTDNSGGEIKFMPMLWQHPKTNSLLKKLNTMPSGEGLFIGIDKNGCSAPTYQQAFKWFREEYNIDTFPSKTYNYYFHIYVNDELYEENGIKPLLEGETFEEAQEVCLRKLIEIIKEKSNTSQ